MRARRDGNFRRATSAVIPVQQSAGAIIFSVKVQPRAKRNAVVGELGDALKLALTAPPIEGRANEACIAFLAELLNVPRSSITIASGQNSRRKLIRVAGVTAEQFHSRLADHG